MTRSRAAFFVLLLSGASMVVAAPGKRQVIDDSSRVADGGRLDLNADGNLHVIRPEEVTNLGVKWHENPTRPLRGARIAQ